MIAYARYTVQNAFINKLYRSWLLERNGEGKCVSRFYFMSVYMSIVGPLRCRIMNFDAIMDMTLTSNFLKS